MQIWIIIDDEPNGPFDLDKVREMRLAADTPVWHDGMTDWQPASTVPELVDSLDCEVDSIADVVVPPIPVVAPVVDGDVSVPSQQATTPPPPNYLAWCIVTIFLCCIPASIVALIYSLKVNDAWAKGDYDRSRGYSEKVEWWLMISIVLGLVSMPFSLLLL